MYDFNYDNDPTGPRRSRFWKLINEGRLRSQPWRWPLTTLGDREPIVLAEHIDSGERRGIDLGYESRPYDAELYVPVYATQAGEVMFCAETRTGSAISLRHLGTEWATYYGHLSKVFLATDTNRRRPECVRAGDVIGYAAKSPIHIRFELVKWNDASGFVSVVPMPVMKTWTKPIVRGPASSPIQKVA